jgi:hypothetical protein
VREFEAVEMDLHAVVARAALGAMRGGEEAARTADDAHAWMRTQGVVAPAKLAAMLAPGFAPLASPSIGGGAD